MKYNSPELLLVGAAQNLVLGTDPKLPLGLNHDDDFTHTYLADSPLGDSECW